MRCWCPRLWREDEVRGVPKHRRHVLQGQLRRVIAALCRPDASNGTVDDADHPNRGTRRGTVEQNVVLRRIRCVVIGWKRSGTSVLARFQHTSEVPRFVGESRCERFGASRCQDVEIHVTTPRAVHARDRSSYWRSARAEQLVRIHRWTDVVARKRRSHQRSESRTVSIVDGANDRVETGEAGRADGRARRSSLSAFQRRCRGWYGRRWSRTSCRGDGQRCGRCHWARGGRARWNRDNRTGAHRRCGIGDRRIACGEQCHGEHERSDEAACRHPRRSGRGYSPGLVISSGLIHSSYCSLVSRPEWRADSRRVMPSWWAYFANFAEAS